MIKRCGSQLLVAITVVALAACTSLRVKSDVNTALYHAGKCHTFAWTGTFREDSPLRDTIANPVNESRLRAAIAAHLQSLGMVASAADADCLVGYGIVSGRAILTFFLACVIVAGLYGGATVNRRIVLVQSLPAAIALALVWLS